LAVAAVKLEMISVTFSTVERVAYVDPVVYVDPVAYVDPVVYVDPTVDPVADSTVDPIATGLPIVGFGLAVVVAGLAMVCGLTFCVDVDMVVVDGAEDAIVDL